MTTQGITVPETGDPLPGAQSTSPTQPSAARSRVERWLNQLARFVVGQGSLQAVNLVTGFLLIRWLSVENYAVYSLTTGFQGTIGVLAELGLGGSMVALLAGRTDSHIMGRYLRSTKHYRNRFFLALVPIVVFTFPFLALRQGWGWPLIAGLLLAILVALYYQTSAICHSIPLIVHQQLRPYYQAPTLLGGLRLLVCFILQCLSTLTAAVAIWISSLASVVQAWIYQKNSSAYAIEPAESDPAANREVLDYIRPLIPSTVFYALQGQITILVISWFGQSQNIAEVGALGRIGQLFVMLGAFNSVIVAPLIARTPRSALPMRYGQVLCGAVVVSLALLGLSVFEPEWLLMLLGEKYRHLQSELAWAMGSACIYYLTGVMWTMHSAKKWVFTWTAWIQIAAVLATQICGAAFMDLSTTRNVLTFSLFSALAGFAVHIIWGAYGFIIHESRRTEASSN